MSVAITRKLASVGKAAAFSRTVVGRRVARDLQTAEATGPTSSGVGVPECDRAAVGIPSLELPIVGGVGGVGGVDSR